MYGKLMIVTFESYNNKKNHWTREKLTLYFTASSFVGAFQVNNIPWVVTS